MGNSTSCSSCSSVCCFQTSSTTGEGGKSRKRTKYLYPYMGPPLYWQICSVLPALDRKVELVEVVFRAGDKVGRRLMVLSSLSTLLSDGPTARGLEIVLSSFSLQKQQGALCRLINTQICVEPLGNKAVQCCDNQVINNNSGYD